jgi:hypothetical protein
MAAACGSTPSQESTGEAGQAESREPRSPSDSNRVVRVEDLGHDDQQQRLNIFGRFSSISPVDQPPGALIQYTIVCDDGRKQGENNDYNTPLYGAGEREQWASVNLADASWFSNESNTQVPIPPAPSTCCTVTINHGDPFTFPITLAPSGEPPQRCGTAWHG